MLSPLSSGAVFGGAFCVILKAPLVMVDPSDFLPSAKCTPAPIFSFVFKIVTGTCSRVQFHTDIFLTFFSCLSWNKYSFWFWWQGAVYVIWVVQDNNCYRGTFCELTPRFCQVFMGFWITVDHQSLLIVALQRRILRRNNAKMRFRVRASPELHLVRFKGGWWSVLEELFLPMMSCLVDWIGDSVPDSCQSWCLLLNFWFASFILISDLLLNFFFFFGFISCARFHSGLRVASSFFLANLSSLSWSPLHVQRLKQAAGFKF